MSEFNMLDYLSLVRMHWLTQLGKKILPSGYWGHNQPEPEDQNRFEKTLYLTFDDGPNPETTEKLLDVLEAENALATFFNWQCGGAISTRGAKNCQ